MTRYAELILNQWYRMRRCPRVYFHLSPNHVVYKGYVILPQPSRNRWVSDR